MDSVIYSYQPLDPASQDIRLLTLEEGAWESTISCQLQKVSLDEGPSYEALSYVWGDPNDLREIQLCGCRYLITAKLEIALRHLRQKNEYRVLWVDALCINQADLKEREAQMKHMRSIYKQAQSAISWVGEASEDSEEAVNLIRELGQFALSQPHTLTINLSPDSSHDGSAQTTCDRIENLGFPLRSKNLPALWRFLERDFWTRIWIIQELAVRGVLEQSSGEIVCGSSSVPRFFFDAGCSLILNATSYFGCIRAESGEVDEPLRSMPRHKLPQGLDMLRTVLSCNGTPYMRDFSNLLRVTRHFRATDPRDKIYALLGVVCENQSNFPADYSKTFDETAKSLVKFLVEQDQTLNIVMGNNFNPKSAETSWISELTCQRKDQRHNVLQVQHLQASGKTKPHILFGGEGNNVMSARGIQIGKLHKVVDLMKLNDSVFEAMISRTAKETMVTELFENLARIYKSISKDEKNVFWRALVMDRDEMSGVCPAPVEFEAEAQKLFGNGNWLSGIEPVLTKQDLRTKFLLPFLNSMLSSLLDRCFFTTTSGHMGLGPHWARPGDVAAILYGCDAVAILRPAGSYFQIVGNAYVQGIMHGEFIEKSVESDSEIFHIR